MLPDISRPSLVLILLLITLDPGEGSVSDYPCIGKEKITKFRFYLQDVVFGENKTVWQVARSALTEILPSRFGVVSVLDNLATSEPGRESREVGRIQGLIAMADLHEKAIAMLLNMVFTQGEYNGSSLCILGRNPVDEEVREVPIVAGTGAFRMARGYAITRTISRNGVNSSVIQYDTVVLHANHEECMFDST